MSLTTPGGYLAQPSYAIDPAVRRGLEAGQRKHWTELQADVSQRTAEVANAYMGEGIPDASMAMPYLKDANAKAAAMKVAQDARDQEILRLGDVAADPRGADMFARFERGELPGYAITGDPSVLPAWRRRVVEASMAERKDPSIYGRAQLRLGSPSREGMAPTALMQESLSQMEVLADRMSQGRGGAGLRDAVGWLQQAIASGDADMQEYWTGQLRQQLSPMMRRFESRYSRESGLDATALGDAFMQRVVSAVARRAAAAREAAAAPVDPKGQSGGKGSGTKGSPATSSPSRPTRTPDGLTIHSHDSAASFFDAVKKDGAGVSAGDMVVVAGVPHVATPTTSPSGAVEWSLKPALVFGGTSVPDPTEYADAASYGESLSEAARQSLLEAMTSDPSVRSGLPREAVEQAARVRSSRVGLMTTRMSPKDRQRAMMDLRQQEDELLYGALSASLGQVGRRNAFSASSIASAEADAKSRDEGLRDMGPPMTRESPGGDGLGEPVADPDLSRTWSELGAEQRSLVNAIVEAYETTPYSSEEKVAGGERMSKALARRLLTMVLRGSDVMDVLAEVEKDRPGATAAFMGGGPDAAAEIQASWSRYQSEFAEATSRSPSQPQLRSLLERQHSYMVVMSRSGLLDAETQAFFDSLPEQSRMDPKAYAEEVMRQMAPARQETAAAAAAPAAADAASPASGREGPASESLPPRQGDPSRISAVKRWVVEGDTGPGGDNLTPAMVEIGSMLAPLVESTEAAGQVAGKVLEVLKQGLATSNARSKF